MDPLIQDDIETSRASSPQEKLEQAFELMETGIRLKRAALRQALPTLSEAEVDEALERWLFADD